MARTRPRIPPFVLVAAVSITTGCQPTGGVAGSGPDPAADPPAGRAPPGPGAGRGADLPGDPPPGKAGGRVPVEVPLIPEPRVVARRVPGDGALPAARRRPPGWSWPSRAMAGGPSLAGS